YHTACSRLTPSGAFCASASRSRICLALRPQARISGQCGQVSAATNTPVASPIRWLLADECAENQWRTKCACSYTERSQRRSNSLSAIGCTSCQAIAQLTRRIAASSALDQFGPRPYGQAMNQLSSCSASASKYARLPESA